MKNLKYPKYLKKGDKYNKLTILYPDITYNKNKKPYIWKYFCKCECGNIKSIIKCDIVRNITKSCGCLKNEILKKQQIKGCNKYTIKNNIIYVYTNGNKLFLLDKKFEYLLKEYYWFTNNRGYICAKNKNQKNIMVHRIITNCPNNLIVDHINHKLWDNRLCNLRICNQSKNCMNAKLSYINTSGYKGVNFRKSDNRWVARININKKRIVIGAFDNKEDAIKARKEAENKYYKEYSLNASMKIAEKYNKIIENINIT